MSDPFPFSPDVLPEHLLLLVLFNLLHLLVWLAALVIGFRRRWWWGLILLMPLFYPFGLLVLILKRTRKMGWVVAAHGLLVALWVAGGAYLKSREWHQLLAVEEALQARGKVLDPAMLHNAPEVVPENNVWDHPLLITLAEAGQSNVSPDDNIFEHPPSKPDAGELARGRMEEEYAWIALPWGTPQGLRFDQLEEMPTSVFNPLQTFYSLAWAQKYEEDHLQDESEVSEEPFENLESLLNALKPNYAVNQDRFRAFVEAMKREQDVYPYNFDNGPHMMLPHLAKLKALSQRARQRLFFEAYRRDAMKSFQTMQDMVVVHRTGMSDMMISRLVELANWSSGLACLVAVQNQHLWSDEQWLWMEQILSEIQFEASIPKVMDMERAFLSPWLRDLADKDIFSLIVWLETLDRGIIRRPLPGGGKTSCEGNGWRVGQCSYAGLLHQATAPTLRLL